MVVRGLVVVLLTKRLDFPSVRGLGKAGNAVDGGAGIFRGS